MESGLKIPAAYKTLLAIAMVLGPIAWLMFTDDGRRRTDMAMMWLLGRPAFDAAIDAFSPALTEQRMREAFPALQLVCADEPGALGERLCGARIGSFNQYPAQAVVWYLADDHLSAVKLVYEPAYHDAIRAWVRRRVGDADMSRGDGRGTGTDGDRVSVWPVAEGVLVMKSGELAPDDEPALLWLSPRAARALGEGSTAR